MEGGIPYSSAYCEACCLAKFCEPARLIVAHCLLMRACSVRHLTLTVFKSVHFKNSICSRLQLESIFYSISVICLPLCQTSCPLRTVHFDLQGNLCSTRGKNLDLHAWYWQNIRQIPITLQTKTGLTMGIGIGCPTLCKSADNALYKVFEAIGKLNPVCTF